MSTLLVVVDIADTERVSEYGLMLSLMVPTVINTTYYQVKARVLTASLRS